MRQAVSFIYHGGRRSPALFLCLFLLTAMSAAAGVLVVGSPANSDNSYPFGWPATASGSEYQQVYSRTQFAQPITITGLEFYNTQYNSGTSAIQSGTWTIDLSTTSADWNTLSTAFAANTGADNTTVFSGNLAQPWAFGDTLKILLSTPFTYDPTHGNLLMDIVPTGLGTANNIAFDANSGNQYLGRVYPTSGRDNGLGLVTGFDYSDVPEPSSLALFGLGAAAVGLARRRLFC